MGKESLRLLDSTSQAHLQYSACEPDPTFNVPVILGLANGDEYNAAEACEHKNVMWDFFIPKENYSFKDYCIGTAKDIGQYAVNVTCSDKAKVAICVTAIIGFFCVLPPATAVAITYIFPSKPVCVGCLGVEGIALGGIALPPLMTCTGLSVCALFERVSREKDQVINTVLTELVRRVEYGVRLSKQGGVVSMQPAKGTTSTNKEKMCVDLLKECFAHYKEKQYQAMLAGFEKLKEQPFPIKIEKNEVITGTNYKITIDLAKQT